VLHLILSDPCAAIRLHLIITVMPRSAQEYSSRNRQPVSKIFRSPVCPVGRPTIDFFTFEAFCSAFSRTCYVFNDRQMHCGIAALRYRCKSTAHTHIRTQRARWEQCMTDEIVVYSIEISCCHWAVLLLFFPNVLRHDVKLLPHFHCHCMVAFCILMCHEAGQSAFLRTQLYLSMNLYHTWFSNVSWH